MQAQDVMTPWVATISPDATVQEAAKMMLERSISAIAVLDSKDRMIGIVSEGDLVRRPELGTDAPRRSWWLGLFADDTARQYAKSHGAAVRDVMTSPVVSVRRTTALQGIARLMEKHRIKRVPVLEAGRLVGIVSRADLVRRLATMRARPASRAVGDRAVRRRVLEQLFKSGVDVLYVNVTVEGGTVHLWGGVRSATQQKALRAAARAAEGARKVEDHTFVMTPHVTGALGAE